MLPILGDAQFLALSTRRLVESGGLECAPAGRTVLGQGMTFESCPRARYRAGVEPVQPQRNYLLLASVAFQIALHRRAAPLSGRGPDDERSSFQRCAQGLGKLVDFDARDGCIVQMKYEGDANPPVVGRGEISMEMAPRQIRPIEEDVHPVLEPLRAEIKAVRKRKRCASLKLAPNATNDAPDQACDGQREGWRQGSRS